MRPNTLSSNEQGEVSAGTSAGEPAELKQAELTEPRQTESIQAGPRETESIIAEPRGKKRATMMIVQNLSWRIRTLAQLNTDFPLHVYYGPHFLIIGHLCCLSLPNFVVV